MASNECRCCCAWGWGGLEGYRGARNRTEIDDKTKVAHTRHDHTRTVQWVAAGKCGNSSYMSGSQSLQPEANSVTDWCVWLNCKVMSLTTSCI